MTLLPRVLRIARIFLFAATLACVLWSKFGLGDLEELIMWLVAALVFASWLLAWLDGDLRPQLRIRRQDKPREFVTIQLITGAALAGLCYLILVTFHS